MTTNKNSYKNSYKAKILLWYNVYFKNIIRIFMRYLYGIKLRIFGLVLPLFFSLLHAETKEKTKQDKPTKENLILKQNFVSGIYIGTGLMKMESEFYTKNYKMDKLPGDYSQSMFGGNYGLKFGYDMYFLERHGVRLYLDYMHSYFNSNEQTLGKFNMDTIGLNAQYRFVIIDSLSAFAGVGLALNLIDTQHLKSMVSLGGSFNVGMAYMISFLEFELSLRYLAYDINDKSSSYLPNILGQQTAFHIVELDSPVNILFGVNFRF